MTQPFEKLCHEFKLGDIIFGEGSSQHHSLSRISRKVSLRLNRIDSHRFLLKGEWELPSRIDNPAG
jgi:hypothetical protein